MLTRSLSLGIMRQGALLKQWIPQTLVVEDAQPTKVIMTSDTANTSLVASDFTVSGFTVSSLARDATNKILTLTLSAPVIYGDVVGVSIKTTTYTATNNINYINFLKRLFTTHVVGLWPLSDVSGTVATDVSGNNRHGLYCQSPALNQPGINGSTSMRLFNGTHYFRVLTANFTGINPDEGFISFFYKATSADTWITDNAVMFLQYPASDTGAISLNRVNNINMSYHGSSWPQHGNPFGTRWFNFGLRWSVLENSLKLYINGICQPNSTTITAFTSKVINTIFLGWNEGGISTASNNNMLMLDYAPSDADIRKIFNPIGLIGVEGDSRSQGSRNWMQEAVELGSNQSSEYAYGKNAIYTNAVGGTGTAAMIARASAMNTKIITGLKNTLVVWNGVNDADTLTAQQIYDNLKNYCISARTSGWQKIVICSEIDAGNTVWHTTKKAALNTLIYADHSFADALADLGARSELQNYTNGTYYSDVTHLNAAGDHIVAMVIGNALASLGI